MRWGSTHKWTLLDPIWTPYGMGRGVYTVCTYIHVHAPTCIYMYIALPCIGGIYMYMYVHTHRYILYVHDDVQHVTSPHLMSRGQIT